MDKNCYGSWYVVELFFVMVKLNSSFDIMITFNKVLTNSLYYLNFYFKFYNIKKFVAYYSIMDLKSIFEQWNNF